MEKNVGEFIWTRKALLCKRQTNTLRLFVCVCVSRKYQEVLLFTKYQLSYLGNKLCMTPWSWEWGEKAWNARPDKVYANSRTVLYLAAFYKRNDVRDGEGILKHDSSLSRWPKPTNRTSPRQTCQETFYARNLCVTFFFFLFSFKKRKEKSLSHTTQAEKQ